VPPRSPALRLARAMKLLSLDPATTSAADLAEAILLASYLPRVYVPTEPKRLGRDGEASSITPPTDASTEFTDLALGTTAKVESRVVAEDQRVGLFVAEHTASNGAVLRATRVPVPAAAALPDKRATERALRPFMRRSASRSQLIFDATATAEMSARRQHVTPVFRAALERSFDVALLVEGGDGMQAWDQTVGEFRTLLARHGAFRRVRMWRFTSENNAVTLQDQYGAATTERSLIEGSGRQLVLILSNGTSAAWRSQALHRLLGTLGRSMPVALLHMLPPRAWPFTALGDAFVEVRTFERGAANRQLHSFDAVDGRIDTKSKGIAIPVLTLEPDRLGAWAHFVMTPQRKTHPAVWISDSDRSWIELIALPIELRDESVLVRERIAEFRAMASVSAYRLIRLLAGTGAPVTLPVMRLIQHASGVDSSPMLLTEILLSGLLRRTSSQGAEAFDEGAIFEFLPGVREFLAGSLSNADVAKVDDALQPTYEQIRRFIEMSTGRSPRDFSALVLDLAGDKLLPESARAFIKISRKLYEQRGLLPPPTIEANRMIEAEKSDLAWSASPGVELLNRLSRKITRPEFGITSIDIDGMKFEVQDQIVIMKPFCYLLEFTRSSKKSHWNKRIKDHPTVLVVAPMSGHYSTLLRDTVRELLHDHKVFITNWIDRRLVPSTEGSFDLDEFVLYTQEFIRYLGPEVNVISVGQAGVPMLAAISLMASAGEFTPRTMIAIGCPFDARRSPTYTNILAMEKSLSWFSKNTIGRVSSNYPGADSLACHGFFQLPGIVAMNLHGNQKSHVEYFFDLVHGFGATDAFDKDFLEEFNCLMDIPAELYLKSIEIIYQDFLIATGLWSVDGQSVRPQDIKTTKLLTIEGEFDEIVGTGQTYAAHDLCKGVPPAMRLHYESKGAGHYDLFAGLHWRRVVYPLLRGFIASR
jgi:poly(3-hydroxybutyrate) depolymerase